MAHNECKPVTHCIFDMDGLLIDSQKLYRKMFNDNASKYGKAFTWEHEAAKMGLHRDEAALKIIEMLELPISIEEFITEWKIQEEMTFAECELMPGAHMLLKHLKAKNVPIALATSSSEDSYKLKTNHLQDTFSLFDHKVFGDSDPDVKQGKPKPDIFLVAASRFPDNPSPSKCLVFEDAPNGVLAALSAGMQVVMVPSPEIPNEVISKDVTLKLNSLEEFRPEFFGLPKFDN